MGQDSFIGEFKRWRDVRGLSQMRLAREMGYDRSYISKIETGHERPSVDFAARADEVLRAGGALRRALREGESRREREPAASPGHAFAESADSVGSIVVEHDDAELTYDGRFYHARQRRKLFNGGREPITQYLIRISVDRYPGSPERSNQLYRRNPLSWDELNLHAFHGRDRKDRMSWNVQHDRDAFKEIWLLFENDDSRFPLYPGETTWIDYSYSVSDDKWGPWFQRAVRLPTRHLNVRLDFPADLDPVVWGIETTMTAASFPFRTAIARTDDGDRRRFAWSTEDPPLHARYRLEWRLRACHRDDERDAASGTTAPSQVMRGIGIVQEGDPILRRTALPFALPAEAEDARRLVTELRSAMERVSSAHQFTKGMGIAAPQIGIGRAAAIVQTTDSEVITLINPVVVEELPSIDEQYEGCLSFFDVRGMVPRPLAIHVEHQDPGGQRRITIFERGIARLVAHEIDHLNGLLYIDRMRSGVEPIPVSEYRGGGRPWEY